MINLHDIDFLKFPGGELHLPGEENTKWIYADCIYAPLRDADDLMKLLLLTDAANQIGKKLRVFIPYLPYARQDRVANYGEALSTKVFAKIINLQHYEKVICFDPHSDVCTALLDNVEIRRISEYFIKHILNVSTDEWSSKYAVLAPDAGAYKRLSKTFKEVPLIYATKMRDTKTGKLSNCEIHVGDIDITNRTILVVDDICDGGGTFLMLANEFEKQFNNKLELYVSHGIFSKGLSELFKHYQHIYTTNSFYNRFIPDGLTVYELDGESKHDNYYIKHAL